MKYVTPKIRILCGKNPKQVGSEAWRRFNLYRDGMTAAEALKVGLKHSDFKNDVAKGFIEFTTLDNKPDGTATQPNTNRQAALKRIQALLAKTTANGCTEDEAFAAAAKAGELMDRYGIESSEAEIRDEKCVQGVHGGHRRRPHESKWVSSAVAKYCDCRVWFRTGTGQLVFFGMPADAEVATYMMRVIEGSMDRAYKEFKKTPDYPEFEESRHVRNTFMMAMAHRVNARLREMHAARHTEELKTTSGTSLVLVKTQVVAEQFAASGMVLRKANVSNRVTSNSEAARNAGQRAGDKVHLGKAVTSTRATKVLS